MKRLNDQILVMRALKLVKQELAVEMDKGENNWINSGEVLVRLTTLYSLLDLDRLEAICVAQCAEQRDDKAA